MRCNRCDAEMERIKKKEWFCPECENMAFGTEETHYFMFDPDAYDEMYEDEEVEGPPQECIDCGCDSWPICMDGCNLFAD